MIKHLVFWKLKEEADGRSASENARLVREKLLALKPLIPEILEIECGEDIVHSPASFDLALYSVFKDREGLQTYIEHPEHVKVRDFIQSVVSTRAVVDYEV